MPRTALWIAVALAYVLMFVHGIQGVPQIFSRGVYPVGWWSGSRFLLWLGIATLGWLAVPPKRAAWVAVPACLMALIVPVFSSSDAYLYTQFARVMTEYGFNPYAVSPREAFASDDPFLEISVWEYEVTIYGPALLLIQMPLGWLSSVAAQYTDQLGRFVIMLPPYWLKTFLLLLHLGNFSLIKNIAAAEGADKAGQDRAGWLYLMNPLILLECIANAHNILVTGFFVVAAVHELQRKNYFTSTVLLLFSVLVRYETIWLMPLLMFFFFKNRKFRQLAAAGAGTCVTVGLMVYLAAEYPRYFEWVRWYVHEVSSSLQALALGIFAGPDPGDLGPRLAYLSRSLSAILVPGICIYHFRKTWDVQLLIKLMALVLLLLCCTTGAFHQWYVVPAACLAPLLRPGCLRTAIFIFSVSGLAIHLQEITFFGHTFWPYRVGEICGAFFPWLGYLVVAGVRRRAAPRIQAA